MPELQSTAEVAIDSLGGLGDGIGTLAGKPVFVAKAVPGDRLNIRIVHRNHDGVYGVIEQILSPGPSRTAAPCPYFSTCGGCRLQQLTPADYRAFKTRMLHSALQNAGFPRPEAEVTFIAAGARRRVEFTVAYNNGRVALAFNELRSNTPVAVENCMVLEPQLQALMPPLCDALSQWPHASQLRWASLTAADSGIDVVLTLKDGETPSLDALKPLSQTLGIARLSVRLPDGALKTVASHAPLSMHLGGYAIALPPDAFLQATREGQRLLTETVLAATQGTATIADLFCGIGTYSFPLSRHTRVHAVEGDAAMVRDLQGNIQRHAIASLTAEQRDLFKNPLTAKELARFNAAVINPPRAGAKAQCEQLAQSIIPTIVMISCNPATFARDAKILGKAGFRLKQALAIDQFVYSQHLEIVGVFRR